jgi:hypothetical protein
MSNTALLGSYRDVGGDSLQGLQTITTSTTLTVASPKQGYVSSPAAAVTVTLPTTDVKAGFRYKLDVTGATETNFVALNSGGGNEVDRIGGEGFIEVIALQDAPTTAAHWRVVNIREVGFLPYSSLVFGASGAGGGIIAVEAVDVQWFYYKRDVGNLQIDTAIGPFSLSSTAQNVSVVLPNRFKTIKNGQTPGIIYNNTGNLFEIGLVSADTNSRTIRIERSGNPWSAVTNGSYFRFNIIFSINS